MSVPKDDKDPFGLLSLDDQLPVPSYTDEQWSALKRVIERRRLAEDADGVRVSLGDAANKMGLPAVPLRDALEAALHVYQVDMEFRCRYPAETRAEIQKELKVVQAVARRLLYSVAPGSPAATYGPNSQSLQLALEDWLQRLGPVHSALERGAALPGPAAPKDGTITGVWQNHHRDLSADPKEKLVGELCAVYSRAFGKHPGSADDGPAAQFVRAAARPVADLGSIRRILEKYARDELH